MFTWDAFTSWFNGDAIRPKLATNRLRTLHKPRKDLSLVRLVGGSSSRIASVCVTRALNVHEE